MISDTQWSTRHALIGHRATLDVLERLVARRRFPVAVLLVGPPSVGKGTVARWLAGSLLTERGETLGRPPAAHPDMLRFDFQEGGEVRNMLVGLLHQAHQRPVAAPQRVILLEEVDRLSEASALLLLKAMEDAPPFAKFLLTAVLRARVPATIRSRVFTQALAPVADEELARGLRARGISADRAAELTRLAGGRPGLALRLADDPSVLARYRSWEASLGQLPDAPQAPGTLAESFQDAAHAEEFVLFLQGRLRPGAGGHPAPVLLRRTREATAMLRQHVPAALVVQYVLNGV